MHDCVINLLPTILIQYAMLIFYYHDAIKNHKVLKIVKFTQLHRPNAKH